MLTVEHCTASHSYSTGQNEFRDAFPDSPVRNKSTVSRLVNRFCDTGSVHRVASDIADSGEHFQRNMILFFVFSDFDVIYFLTSRTCIRNGLCDVAIILYMRFFSFYLQNGDVRETHTLVPTTLHFYHLDTV
jgi:hypothetical protein